MRNTTVPPHCHASSDCTLSGVGDSDLIGDGNGNGRCGCGHVLAIDIQGCVGGAGLAVSAGDRDRLDKHTEVARGLVVWIVPLDQATCPVAVIVPCPKELMPVGQRLCHMCGALVMW